MSTNYYVGVRLGLEEGTQERRMFTAPHEPTAQTHGHLYIYVIGPFRTKQAAALMAVFGGGNPHLQHVTDAERMARFKPEMVREAIERVMVS